MNLARRIERYQDETDVIANGIYHEGPALVRRLMATMSLREIARQTGFSPTYLSGIVNQKFLASHGCFLALARLAKKRKTKGE